MLIFVNCAMTLLRCYIIWFAAVGEAYGFEGICCFVTFSTILNFFGVLLRAYILISTTSDVLRFAYLLCRDAWRADAFEAYRRLLVGDAWREIEAGEFYSFTWSISLSHCKRACDVVFQCFLRLSFDVAPFCALSVFMLYPRVPVISFCQLCFFIGLCHILLFYFLWLAGEVSLKIFNFRGPWIAARGSYKWPSRPRLETMSVWGSRKDLQLDFSTEKRSLCVLCCTIFHWLEYLFPTFLGLLTLSTGITVGHTQLALLGGALSVASLFVAWLALKSPELEEDPDSENQKVHSRQTVPAFINRSFPYPEALQQWGEKWCRLGFTKQKRSSV